MIVLDDSVLAYASASYTETATAAASKNPAALKRMVDKLKDLKRRYGKSMLKHTAVIGLISAAIYGIIKALDNPVVADKLAEVSGKLKSVTGLAMLGASLYGLVVGLLDMITPQDEEFNTPTMRQRLDDLAQKNEKLNRALSEVHTQMTEHERYKGLDLGKEHVNEMREARKANRQEKAANTRAAKKTEEPNNDEAENNGDGGIPDDDNPRYPAKPRGPNARSRRPSGKPVHADTEVTAFSFLQQQLPGSVTTQDLFPDVQTYHDIDGAKFLRRIDNMSAQQRNGYARKLARSPELAQGFVDRVFAIVRRLRKDAVGQKVHRLGTFVVKWATIFAVQAIMFKMLVHVTKIQGFAVVGGLTRFIMACLCALNSVLLLVHVAQPEEQDHGIIQSIKKTATRSKALLNQMPLKTA